MSRAPVQALGALNEKSQLQYNHFIFPGNNHTRMFLVPNKNQKFCESQKLWVVYDM